MRAEREARTITRREAGAVSTGPQSKRGSLLLWFGVLGGPIAWTAQLLLTYSLEEWFACSPAALDRGEVLGVQVPDVALLITVSLALVAVLAGIVALSCYRRLRNEPADETRSRARWMAVAGIMNSILYLIIILASLAPPFLLRVCESSP
jgi:hypothetical protein